MIGSNVVQAKMGDEEEGYDLNDDECFGGGLSPSMGLIPYKCQWMTLMMTLALEIIWMHQVD